MNMTASQAYQSIKHALGSYQASIALKVPHELLPSVANGDVSNENLMFIQPRNEKRLLEESLMENAELSLLRNSVERFQNIHETAADLLWHSIKNNAVANGSHGLTENIEWVKNVLSDGQSAYQSSWVQKKAFELIQKINAYSKKQWANFVSSQEFAPCKIRGVPVTVFTSDVILSGDTLAHLEALTGTPVAALVISDNSFLLNTHHTDAFDDLNSISPFDPSLRVELDHSDNGVVFKWKTTNPSVDENILNGEIKNLLKAPLNDHHFAVILMSYGMNPKVKTYTPVRMEQLDSLFNLRMVGGVTKESVPACILLNSHDQYYIGIKGGEGRISTLAQASSDPFFIDAIRSGQDVIVKSSAFSNTSFILPLDVIASSKEQYAYPLYRREHEFVSSIPLMTEVSLGRSYPDIYTNTMGPLWDEYRQLQNAKNRYIRDPLSASELRDMLQDVTHHEGFVNNATDGMTAWMQQNDTKCHVSLDVMYDPVNSDPYFISMNIYSLTSRGVHYRNVSMVINEIGDRAVILSPQARLNSGLSNEMHKQLGINARGVDMLLDSALNRATSQSGFKFTSQWVNGFHADRRLAHVLPLLMERISKNPSLDSMALVKKQELFKTPTYPVLIYLSSDKREYAQFEDAEVPCAPNLLGAFLRDPNRTVLRCNDGQYELRKDGDQLSIHDANRNITTKLFYSPQELRSYSLQKSGTYTNRQLPAKSEDVLNRARIVDLVKTHLNTKKDAWNRSTFAWPSYADRTIQSHAVMPALNQLFQEFQQNCDYTLPLDALSSQFEMLVKNNLSSFYNDVQGPLFFKTNESETNRDLLSRIGEDPLLLDILQTKVPEQDLRQLLQFEGAPIESPWVMIDIHDALKWNMARSLSVNAPLIALSQSQSLLMRIAENIEPSRARETQDVFKLISDTTGIPRETVSRAYKMMYDHSKVDLTKTSYLPGRREQAPLMRTLLARDLVIWNALFNRHCLQMIDPNMKPLLHELKRMSDDTKALQWTDINAKPFISNAQRELTRVPGEYKNFITPTLEKARVLLSWKEPVQIESPEKWDRLFQELSVLNSIGTMMTSLGQDRTIDMRHLLSVRDEMISYFSSDDFKGKLNDFSQYVEGRYPQGVLITDNGKLSSHVMKVMRAEINGTKWPSLPWLNVQELASLRTLTESALNVINPNREASKNNAYWRAGIQKSSFIDAIVKFAPKGLVLTDSQRFISRDWQGLVERVGIEPIPMTIQQFASTLPKELVSASLSPQERARWTAYVGGDGSFPKLQSVVHKVLRRAEDKLSEPRRLFDFPLALQNIVQGFNYRPKAPHHVWFDIQPEAPKVKVNIQVDAIKPPQQSDDVPDFKLRR